MHELTATVYGHELRFATEGDGEPLLLVPGHTMSIDRWVDAGYVAALARRFTVIAFDPLGHGRSSRSDRPDDYSPDRLVAHITAVLDVAGAESAHVWGYSRGALMGLMAARAHPSRIRSLVYGGNVLFDARPIMESLGMVPDDATMDRAHARALDGDWGAYWEMFPLPLTDDVKRSIEERNHLPSISASGIAGMRWPVAFEAPAGVELFAYWGSDEIYHQLNIEAAAERSIEYDVVPGGHAEAFEPSAAALELVGAFLDRGRAGGVRPR